MASRLLAELISRLEPDPWRREVGFGGELHKAMQEALSPPPERSPIQSLSRWLASHQPCLFGRIAAKKNLIHFCILREEDLLASDDLVADKIHTERLEWIRRGWEGDASAFVIAVLSATIAHALPSSTVLEIARRICALYLLREVDVDQACLDEIFLEQPGKPVTCWKWLAGVNYFSAQGDKRWWQDHAIPAGMAFSVNSVGHMVRTGRLAQVFNEFEQVMGQPLADFVNHRVDSLEKALEMAMMTIARASDACSGKATRLIRKQRNFAPALACPVDLPASLRDMDHCAYEGLYHTDITLPREYFRPDVERPATAPIHALDFTYLFDNSLDNPEHRLMGRGLQIRGSEPKDSDEHAVRLEKRRRGMPDEVSISNEPLLQEALTKR